MSDYACVALSLYLDGIPSAELERELVQRKFKDTAEKIERALLNVAVMREKQQRRAAVLDRLEKLATYGKP